MYNGKPRGRQYGAPGVASYGNVRRSLVGAIAGAIAEHDRPRFQMFHAFQRVARVLKPVVVSLFVAQPPSAVTFGCDFA